MQTPQTTVEPQAVKKQRKILNRWSVFLLIIVSAGGSVLYVSNVVKVQELLKDVQRLERSRDSLVSANEALRSQMTRLQSAERIHRLAQEKLGMIEPTSAPITIERKELKKEE